MSIYSMRLDAIPYCRFHTRLLIIGGLGYLFDAMDVAIIAFVLPVVKTEWHLVDEQIGVLAAAAAVGGFFGAIFAGAIGDWIGRRAVMMWALGLYSLASAGSAFAGSWTEFLAWRVMAGVGLYAESAIIAPFLAEFAGPSFRGRYIGSLTGFFAFGFVIAALLGYAVIPIRPDAWRCVLVIAALPIGMLLWWRRSLPESPRWLESQGRLREAERIVSSIEREFQDRGGKLTRIQAAISIEADQRHSLPFAHSVAQLFHTPLLRSTCMALIVWFSLGFSYYAFFTWIPSLLVQSGMTIAKSYAYSLGIYIAQVPGYFSAAILNDIIGRQAVITTYMFCAAVAAFGVAFSHSDTATIISGAALSFFMNGAYAGLYTYTPELFPTEVRATAHGVASSLSRIGAVASPIIVGFVFPLHGFMGVFGMTCTILFLGTMSVLVLGVSTRNRSLEQITTR